MRFGNASGFTSLLKDGYKHMGGLEEAILKNIEACKALAAITRTSLGPNGMNKLIVNHLEKLFITSDAATIVEELEVVHPAAKMMAKAALMQIQEVGDGSNFVVTMTGELLTLAEGLLRIGVHPSEVVSGYKKAADAAAKAVEELASTHGYTLQNPRDEDELAKALVPVIASKQGGFEDQLAQLVAEACISVMPPPTKKASVSVDNVRVAKLNGGSTYDSQVVKGVVVLHDAATSIKHVSKAKVAVFGCSIEASTPETKGVVVIKNADELKAYNKGEERLMEETIKGIADAGVGVIVAGGSISEIALHFIEKYGMLAIRIHSKYELRRLCKAVGATALVRVAPPMPAELGYCDEVSVQELSSRLVTVFRQDDEDSGISTIVLRGATQNLLDDMERAINDAVNVAKVLCRDGRMVPGGGAAEMHMAKVLLDLGTKTTGLEQYAIHKFAEALEVVPRMIAENSGQSTSDVISALNAAHAEGNSDAGVDIVNHGVKSAKDTNVYDSLSVKLSALRLASETAITLLNVDQIIMSKQAGGPKPRAPGAPDAM